MPIITSIVRNYLSRNGYVVSKLILHTDLAHIVCIILMMFVLRVGKNSR